MSLTIVKEFYISNIISGR